MKSEVTPAAGAAGRGAPGISLHACATFSRSGPPWRTATGRWRAATAAAMRRVLGRDAGIHLFARHLRSETHRSHRQAQGLHRLRPGHPRSGAPAGRVRGHRRHGESAKVMALAARSLLHRTRMKRMSAARLAALCIFSLLAAVLPALPAHAGGPRHHRHAARAADPGSDRQSRRPPSRSACTAMCTRAWCNSRPTVRCCRAWRDPGRFPRTG